MLRTALPRAAAAAAAFAGGASLYSECKSKPDGVSKLRSTDFNLASHYHGKRSVRVLRVEML